MTLDIIGDARVPDRATRDDDNERRATSDSRFASRTEEDSRANPPFIALHRGLYSAGRWVRGATRGTLLLVLTGLPGRKKKKNLRFSARLPLLP